MTRYNPHTKEKNSMKARTSLQRLLMAMMLTVTTSVVIPYTLQADEAQPLSISLEGYPYPYPVSYLPVLSESQDLKMAYMDVQPTSGANGKSVLLLHGKNFSGTYWKDTIAFLAGNGYRVIVPDQIGFGKSSKPNIHYSFHALAANTKKILDSLGIREVTVVGHSMGGMLATRFALLYPETATSLVLENPIGLEDYRQFVPYVTVDEQYQIELKASAAIVRNYHKTYYVNWKPEFGEFAEIAVRQQSSGEYPRLALSSALTYEMIYEQPVCHEFSNIKARTLLVIGQSDRTVVGKARVKKELLPQVGQYPQLGRTTVKLIQGAKLVELDNVGHIPHLEMKGAFHEALLNFLKNQE
jgi:pimeloyl-ACP methyl ester carboxylesterase